MNILKKINEKVDIMSLMLLTLAGLSTIGVGVRRYVVGHHDGEGDLYIETEKNGGKLVVEFGDGKRMGVTVIK